MPVTVTIPDREKQAAAKVVPAALDDFAHPSERREGAKAFGLWLLFIFVLVAGLSFAPATQPYAIGVFVWWLASCLAYFFIAPKMILRRLRMHGREIAINSQTQPRLQALLTKGSAILGTDRPEGFLLEEGISQIKVFSPPPFIIITQASIDLLQTNELDCLVLRQLVHLRQNHARRLMMLRFLNDTPGALRFLAWPVGLYAFLLRTWWTDLAEMTADRLTLLVVKNHKILSSALIKQHAATDPLMSEHEILASDVDAYIEQNGLISLEGREISTQYKLGQAIHENPYLEERLQELTAFAKSPEFKVALQKLAEASSNKAAPERK